MTTEQEKSVHKSITMVLEESNSCDSSSPVEGSLKGAAVVHVAVQEGNSIIPNSRECRAEGVSCMKVGCQIVTILVLPVDFCSFFKHLIMVSCYTVLTDSGSGDKYQIKNSGAEENFKPKPEV